ncbi:hypothetical protein Tco_0624420 [Tanacetum coccineum]|uniref:Reverse transcriptase domain-containing protein n=1 Tax=Tanacetum coccineum TaxID=301880 RepID=A0ABQ4WDY8_9ASTR
MDYIHVNWKITPNNKFVLHPWWILKLRWHRKLVSTPIAIIQNLASNTRTDLPKLSFERHFCDTCGLGRQGNANNRTWNEVSTSRVLELLHLDLFGLSPIPCYRGNFYTLMIVDDHSNYTWVEFVESKDDVLENLPQPKSSPSVEDDRNNEPRVQDFNRSPSSQINVSDEGYPKSVKEARVKVSSQYWKPPIYYDDDDDDDEESSIPLRDIISELPQSFAIVPDFPITNSLIIEDEHLNTISETESAEENESSVKDLNLTPSESEDLSDYKSECDVPVCDDSSSKNEGLDDIVSIPPGKEIDQLDAIPDSVQSLLNRANSIIFLIEEFVGELAPIDPIPPGIVEANFDPKEDIRLIEKLLNDDSSPEELNYEIPDAIIKSFSPSPIPVEDSDSLMEEIDIFLAPDDSIPPGIENDDYDSEGDVLFLKELLNNDSISLPEYESFHVDFYNVPSSPRPPKKPPDDDVYFDIEPDTGVLTIKVVDDISERYVLKPRILPTQPILSFCPVIETLFPFSFENEDKVFNTSILASKEEKSPHLLSHRGFKAF